MTAPVAYIEKEDNLNTVIIKLLIYFNAVTVLK